MIYTRDIEVDRKVSMYNRRMGGLVIMTVFVCCMVGAYMAGQHTQFKLVIQSFDNAEYATQMLGRSLDRCVTSAARTMSVVLREDAYLHQQIREMPPIKWVQP